MSIVVCLKWVPLRPVIDAVTGTVSSDDRWSGPSPADRAALEIALRLAATRHDTVHVVTVGATAADAMLRDALAAGAHTATRVDAAEPPSSSSVAAALADVIGPLDPTLVICGDWSLDRGSGSVPPFLAAELAIGQACGLVAIVDEPGQPLRAERRLDGGRRERIRIDGPAVLSVEGNVATHRRASLAATLAAQRATITVTQPKQPLHVTPTPKHVGPFRPRARVLDGPTGSQGARGRIEFLTGALAARKPPQKLVLDPQSAADAILAQLAEWGYDVWTRARVPDHDG